MNEKNKLIAKYLIDKYQEKMNEDGYMYSPNCDWKYTENLAAMGSEALFHVLSKRADAITQMYSDFLCKTDELLNDIQDLIDDKYEPN